MVSLCDTNWGNFNKFWKFVKMARVQRVKTIHTVSNVSIYCFPCFCQKTNGTWNWNILELPQLTGVQCHCESLVSNAIVSPIFILFFQVMDKGRHMLHSVSCPRLENHVADFAEQWVNITNLTNQELKR
jgi:hypothetical protein